MVLQGTRILTCMMKCMYGRCMRFKIFFFSFNVFGTQLHVQHVLLLITVEHGARPGAAHPHTRP